MTERSKTAFMFTFDPSNRVSLQTGDWGMFVAVRILLAWRLSAHCGLISADGVTVVFSITCGFLFLTLMCKP